jgi:hypothetical protein
MSAQVTITQLPAAGAITGAESVPIVQNGVTVQTTTAAIAGSPTQTYTYLTVSQTPQLPNSRYFGVNGGLTLSDGGAQGLFNITTTGALASLVGSGTGFQVKTSSTAITSRSIATSGSGVTVANGGGVSGNPTISLTGQVLNLANLSANGLMTITTAGALSATAITGVANQTSVTNGDAVAGAPTVGLASDPIIPGTGAVQIPSGTTAEQPAGVDGKIRYNISDGAYEGYSAGAWRQFSLSGGVTQVNTGTGLTGGPITGVGTISIANTTVTAATYGSASSVPVFAVNAQGQLTSVTNTSIAIDAAAITSGTVPVSRGGTGSTATPVAGSVIYGNGTNYAATLAGTEGQVLTSTGTGTPVWSGINGGTF